MQIDWKRQKNWKIKTQILLGYAVPISVLLASGVLSFLNIGIIDAALKKGVQSQGITVATGDASVGISKGERATRGYVISKNDDLFRDAKIGFENHNKGLDKAEALIINPQQKERAKKLRKIGNDLEKFDSQILELVKSGKQAEAVKLFETKEGVELVRSYETLQNEFDQAQTLILEDLNSQATNATQQMQLLASLGSILAIAICLSAAFLISFRIAQTLTQVANSVTNSSKDITHTVSEQETTILEQSNSVNETTSSIEELGIISLQSAEQAETSATKAQLALNLAEEGTQAVGQTIEGISTLKDQVTAIANQIIRLSEQTAQISTVSDLMADLANQTNMLALNAGVEAARAGEQGKGFAVVAGEIRKLADQSKKSAQQINTLVNEVQSAINSTIMVTDEGTKKATQGINLVEETGDVFTGIADAVNLVFLNSQQISQISKQQAVTMQQVISAMNVINLEAKETVAGIKQVKEATNDLNQAANNLQALV